MKKEENKEFRIEDQIKLYSNEIVFAGHPDKICDQISAAILQYYMDYDRNTRAGIEVCGGKGKIFITGEITTSIPVRKSDIKLIVKNILFHYGYHKKYKIIVNLSAQSPDIAMGVDVGGAGDQGMMFGYACRETYKLLPKAMVILQEFSKWYDSLSLSNAALGCDGKAQITGAYDKFWKLQYIDTFLVSYQNEETKECRETYDKAIQDKIKELCKKFKVDVHRILINPTGKFKVGGFDGDAGLTGRKIVVDAYQSFANVGGGCMNGKDPTKVDFSAAHKARQLAIRYLRQYKFNWCEVQLSYAIGLDRPLAIYIRSNKGNITPDESVYEECKPAKIINDLQLRNLDYVSLAKFGHFS